MLLIFWVKCFITCYRFSLPDTFFHVVQCMDTMPGFDGYFCSGGERLCVWDVVGLRLVHLIPAMTVEGKHSLSLKLCQVIKEILTISSIKIQCLLWLHPARRPRTNRGVERKTKCWTCYAKTWKYVHAIGLIGIGSESCCVFQDGNVKPVWSLLLFLLKQQRQRVTNCFSKVHSLITVFSIIFLAVIISCFICF